TLKLAEQHGTVGRVRGELGRLALRAGKRARAETGIDRAGQSLVSVAIELAAARLAEAAPGRTPRETTGQAPRETPGEAPGAPALAGRDVLVVGAGAMSSVAATTAAKHGAARIA